MKYSTALINANDYVLLSIYNLLDAQWEVITQHTYKEGNFCADWLANCVLQLNINVTYYDDPPIDLILSCAAILAVFPFLVVVLASSSLRQSPSCIL